MTLSIDGPTTLSPARVRWALLALALGGFGIGSTEFVAMGLLPDIAQDLFPTLYADSPADANATAGWMISAYALGVVVGAPTIAAAAARWPRKRLLLVLLTAFTLGTMASAVLPTFELVLVSPDSWPHCRTARTSASPRSSPRASWDRAGAPAGWRSCSRA